MEDANVPRHLDAVGRVNLGSFYTPARYVRCGYGAFFALGETEGA